MTLRPLKRYFSLKRQERHAIAILTVLIAVVFIIQLFLQEEDAWRPLSIRLPTYRPPAAPAFSETPKATFTKPSATLFAFDPNTVSYEEALRLGFPKKTAAILMKYRQKGATFRQPEDLKRLYGLSPELYAHLESYIKIAPKTDTVSHAAFAKFPERRTKREPVRVELNSADSLALVSLRGIGPMLSRRILKYRNALGGFYSLEQLGEVYGLKDSLIQALTTVITIDESQIHKINLNTIDVGVLKKHPYFSGRGAEAVINYRTKHGALQWADLQNLGIFNEEQLRKIKPYLAF